MKLISELENIVAFYSDPKTYLNFIELRPKIYTYRKYESMIAKSLNKKFDKTQDRDTCIDNITEIINIFKDFGILRNTEDKIIDDSEFISIINIEISELPNISLSGKKDAIIYLSDDMEHLVLFTDYKMPIKLTPLWKLIYENLKILTKILNF